MSGGDVAQPRVVPALARWWALGLTAGTALGPLWPVVPAQLMWLGAALCAAAALCGALVTSTRRLVWLALACSVVGSAACGVALAQRAYAAAVDTSLRRVLDRRFAGFRVGDPAWPARVDPVRVRVIVEEDAARRSDVVSLRARALAVAIDGESVPASGGIRLSIAGAVSERLRRAMHAGAEVEAPVALRRPARYLNDGVPDAELARALGGATLQGSIKSGLQVQVLRQGGWLARTVARVRHGVRSSVARTVGSYDALSAAVVTAVVLGDDSSLPDDVRNRWRAAGTYHVLAISGGNIAVLVLIAVGAGRLLGLSPRAAATVSLLVLGAFALVVVPGASVRRAVLMAALHLTARLLDVRTSPWQTLAVAVCVLTAWDPLASRDVGWLLTVGATAALIAASERAAAWDAGPRPRALWRWLRAAVGSTLAVEAVVAPVGLWFFSVVSPIGLLLNVVAVPLMTVGQVAGLVGVSVDWLEGGGTWAGWVAHLAVWTLDACTTASATVPFGTWYAPRPPAGLLALYYAALIAWRCGPLRARRWAGAVVAASGVVMVVALPRLMPRLVPGLRVTMLDVGQGESVLVESRGRRVLVDAGGRPFGDSTDVGRRVVIPALFARGVTALDALLVTHADPDHVGGAGPVVDAFGLGALWWGIDVPGHLPSADALARAAASGVPVRRLREGQRLSIGDVQVRVLHPPAPDWERRRVRNDDSVVLELVHGDVAVLLTGDISADIERTLVPKLTRAPVRVLKVAHHGSRTSTGQALTDGWRPQLAIVSAGRGNTFGHPAPAVLARLGSAGTIVLRTDVDGQITLHANERGVWADTFTGRRVTVVPHGPTADP